MTVKDIAWPDPATIPIGKQGYVTPDGTFSRVTSVLKVLGLSTEALVRWSAGVEREACLAAASEVYGGMGSSAWMSAAGFAKAVQDKIGPTRQHMRQMQKAAEIGSEIHAAIHNTLAGKPVIEPSCDQVTWALMSFDEWWTKSGLKAIRMEQPVWDKDLGYAGTIDIVAEHPANGLGIIDIKSSKGIYDDHHLQVAAYLHAGNNFAPLEWAQIVRLPKNTEDPKFEVKPLGALYDRQLTREQLMQAFTAALTAYKILIAK